jgi:hypothetical protein
MRRRLLLTVPALAIPAALAFGGACTPSNGGSDGGSPNPPAVFVIDSTGSLISFDAQGNRLASVALPTPIGDINGGGIALASGNLYVTVGQPANSVVSFTTGLAPVASPESSSFSGLDVPRGIAFDSHNNQFYVGNGGASVNVFDALGNPVSASGGFPSHYGPSGVAYDPDDTAIWVANYQGYPRTATSAFGFNDYQENGALVQAFPDFSAGPHEEPYSVTVCPKSATGGRTLVVVGYIDDGSGQGSGGVEAYVSQGGPLGGPFNGPLLRPYALSCDPTGVVYIADKTGLYRLNATSNGLSGAALASPGFAGLTPPIYGVLAIAGTGGASSDGGGAGGGGGGGGGAGGGGAGGGGGGGGGADDGGNGDAYFNPSDCAGAPAPSNCDLQWTCSDPQGNATGTIVACYPSGAANPYFCALAPDGTVVNIIGNDANAGVVCHNDVTGAPGCDCNTTLRNVFCTQQCPDLVSGNPDLCPNIPEPTCPAGPPPALDCSGC